MKARFLALAALVLGLASCQNDPDVVAPVGADEVSVQLAVSADELATRAGKDGAADEQNALNSAFGAIDYLQGAPVGDYRYDWENVDLRYVLEVYDVATDYTNATPVKDRQVIIKDAYEPVVFDLRLVPNRDYRFVVFADFVEQGKANLDAAAQLEVEGLRHKIGTTLADIEVIDNDINDEIGDSYFAIKDIKIENSAAQNIVLRRPYGKVRVVATDLAELNLNIDPKTVVVKYHAYNPNKFNAVTGAISGEYVKESYTAEYIDNVRFYMANHVYNDGYDAKTAPAVNGTERNTHITLFTDYILATNEEQTPIHFTMTVKDEAGEVIKETVFNTDIPVQRNYLTTVIGNVLTTATEIKVTIDDNFADEYVENVWNGKAKEPAYDAATKTYTIVEASELAWLADQVNGTTRAGRTFEGETFKLGKDIDLNNDRWTPIGATGKFLGTFDGQNHKITNLFVSESDNTPVGLFANGRVIKNVKVIGAEIYGHYKAGVIIGDGLCAKIDNCHVEDAIVKIVPLKKDDANHAGGIVGYLSAETEAYAKNCSVKNAEITAFRDVAGIAGCANGAAVVTGNTVENVTVTADQTVEYVSNEKDGNATAVAGRVHANATILPNTVGAEVVVIRKVDSTKEMEYAVADAENGATIYVGNGEVALPHFEGKALNFVGISANAAIVEPVSSHIDAFWQGAELNFTDLKIKGTSYTGSANGYVKSAKETYTNCQFVDGYYMFAGDVVTVDNGIFTGKFNSYFWTGSADEITFNKCKFNGVERAVKVCTVGHTGVERKVNFNECEFTATEQKKAAIEIDGTKGSSYIVRINDCTETGFAKGEFTDTTMFNVEGADKVQVYLDGIKWDANGNYTDENGNEAYYATDAASLTDALKEIPAGEAGTINVAAGEYTFPKGLHEGVTINCAEGTVFKGSSNLNIGGATIVGADFVNESGSIHGSTINGNFKDCTFEGLNVFRYCYAGSGSQSVFEDCYFKENGGEWLFHFDGGSGELICRRCTFDGKRVAVGSAVSNLVMEDCTFINGSYFNTYCKTTITGTSFETSIRPLGNHVTLNDCTYYGAPLKFDNLKLFSGYDCKVTVDDKDYAVVSSATNFAKYVNEAERDIYVHVMNHITDNMTLVQKANVNVFVAGNGKVFNKTLYIHGNARHNGAETLTFDGFTFNSFADRDIISSNETGSVERYAHNVTFQNCSFNGDDGVEVIGLRLRQAYNITIKNCTATKLHSLGQLASMNGLTIENVTVEAGSGLNLLNSCANVNIINSNITATEDDGYGIRMDAGNANEVNVKDCVITAYEPVVFRKAVEAFKFNFVGLNTINKGGDYHIVVKSGVCPTLTGADGFAIKLP